MNRMTLTIDGMSCAHCVRAVTEALRDVAGVRVEQVDVGSARLSYDPARTSTDAIRSAVEDAGYSVVGTAA